ncbi:hypothetical protein [Embleya sp. MST-111070]|uniref:hypothetical protein n=1 Tax=Embleya sp. MST-111070 TaxID=3398231 RepID=UPI003F73D9AD
MTLVLVWVVSLVYAPYMWLGVLATTGCAESQEGFCGSAGYGVASGAAALLGPVAAAATTWGAKREARYLGVWILAWFTVLAVGAVVFLHLPYEGPAD